MSIAWFVILLSLQFFIIYFHSSYYVCIISPVFAVLRDLDDEKKRTPQSRKVLKWLHEILYSWKCPPSLKLQKGSQKETLVGQEYPTKSQKTLWWVVLVFYIYGRRSLWLHTNSIPNAFYFSWDKLVSILPATDIPHILTQQSFIFRNWFQVLEFAHWLSKTVTDGKSSSSLVCRGNKWPNCP